MIKPTTIHARCWAIAPLIAAAVISGLMTGLCEIGRSPLAGTFGALAVLCLTLPPLLAAVERTGNAIALCLISTAAAMLAWLALPMDWVQWWRCAAVALTFGIAISGAMQLGRALRIPPIAMSPACTIVGIAWLAWPIWLSPWLAGRERLVSWLAFAHPLLTLNSILIDQGIWTERPQMYGWTALNQDVSYAMPPGIGWCVLLHTAGGLLCFAVAMVVRRAAHSSEFSRLAREPSAPSGHANGPQGA
jgi:hypothetical protein